MAALLTLFVAGTMYWWALIAVASVIILIALDYEKAWLATLALGTALAVWAFAGDGKEYLVAYDWREVAKFACCYLGVAVVWGIIKWVAYNWKILGKVNDLTAEYLRKNKITGKDVPANLTQEWLNYLNRYYTGQTWIEQDSAGNTHYRFRPYATERKKLIVTWMTYWPWSFVWTCLADVVHNIFRFLQRFTSKLMDSIAAWMFKGLESTTIIKKKD